MEPWEFEFWENENKNSPAEEDFEQLRQKDPVAHERIVKKLRRLLGWSVSQLTKAGYLENLKNGIWELKISAGKIEYRFLGPLRRSSPASLFSALCGFKKKDQKLRKPMVQKALKRLQQYKTQLSKL